MSYCPLFSMSLYLVWPASDHKLLEGSTPSSTSRYTRRFCSSWCAVRFGTELTSCILTDALRQRSSARQTEPSLNPSLGPTGQGQAPVTSLFAVLFTVHTRGCAFLWSRVSLAGGLLCVLSTQSHALLNGVCVGKMLLFCFKNSNYRCRRKLKSDR